MKFFTLLLCLFSISLSAQDSYEPSSDFPYGRPNPDAPEQIKDFESMIGICDCTNTNRNPDGSWSEPIKMTWEFKYIMNGTAVQDMALKTDGTHAGSIRQFNADSSRWYVHWYSSKTPSTSLPVWEGNKEDDKIVLYKERKAPNGMDGYYRLTFYDISEMGYKWIGEWIDKGRTVTFPTRKIVCTKKDK